MGRHRKNLEKRERAWPFVLVEWTTGPRTSSWDELWQRILSNVIERLEEQAVELDVGPDYRVSDAN